MPIKISLERFIKSSAQYTWRFRQESYTRQEWETFDIPCICGVAGVFCAYLNDSDDVDEWKEKLKEKAMQELQENIRNIQQQMEALENIK